MVNKISVTQKLIFVLERVENILGKGEIAGNQHFLLFPDYFRKLSSSRVFFFFFSELCIDIIISDGKNNFEKAENCCQKPDKMNTCFIKNLQLAKIYKSCDGSVRRAMFSATFTYDVEQWCKLNLDNVVQVYVGEK